MSRLLLLPIVFVCCAGCAAAQNTDQLFTATRQQLDVTKIVLAQQVAWNKADLNAYLAFFKDAPDTVAMLNVPVRGLENIRTSFRGNFPSAAAMGTLEESDVEVRALGDNFALATGKYHLTRNKKAGGDTSGTFTEIMEKTAAGWRVIFSETA